MPNVEIFPALLDRNKWLNFPLIPARDPYSPGILNLKVAGSTVFQHYRTMRRTQLWQGWAHLTGQPPPIPNTSLIRPSIPPGAFGSLEDPVACFKGVKRPYLNESNGDSVYIYILNPSHTLQWHSSMACVAKLTPSPLNTVLAVYVRLTDSLHIEDSNIHGVVTGWEFVASDSQTRSLPESYGDRYVEEIWRR